MAIVAAVVAFIALPSDEDEIPRDAYTRAAERICIAEKQEIVAAGQSALQEQGGGEQLAAYAAGLVPVAIEWRSALESLTPPPDRTVLSEELSFALRSVAVEAGALARIARDGDRAAVLSQAARVDEATARVEGAVAALGLSRCAEMQISLARGS